MSPLRPPLSTISSRQTSHDPPKKTDKIGDMEAIDIPADRVPEGLKPCEQILKRAKEVKKVEPVVAYWCCFSAAQKALKVQNRSKGDTMFLMSLLDALEEMKAVLGDNDAVLNEAAGAAYIENFALKVFMSADNDDRNGSTGKATIRKFVVAGQFIEVLKCFENGMTEEMEQKLQYARWKAADGARALREGREPTSGPPIPDTELTLPELPSGSPSTNATHLGTPTQNAAANLTPLPGPSPRPSPGGGRSMNLPTIDTSQTSPSDSGRTPQRTNSTASGAWSTVATPGVQEDEDERRFPPDLPSFPSGPVDETPRTPDESGEKKNVRFMGPDGAPLSPAHTHFTVDSYDVPAVPPSSVLGVDTQAGSPRKKSSSFPEDHASSGTGSGSGSGSGGSYSTRSTPTSGSTLRDGFGQNTSSSTATSRPRGDSTSRPRSDSQSRSQPPNLSVNPSGQNAQNGSRTSPRASPALKPTVPPAPPPSLVSFPPPSQPSRGNNLTSPPPSAPPLHTLPPSSTSSPVPSASAPIGKLGRKAIEQTQKHARWAISALEFDDPETARNELRKALALLGG